MASLQEMIDKGMAFFGAAETKVGASDLELSTLKAQVADLTGKLNKANAAISIADSAIGKLQSEILLKDAEIKDLTEKAIPGRQAASILAKVGVESIDTSGLSAQSAQPLDFPGIVYALVKSGKTKSEAVTQAIDTHPNEYSAWLAKGAGKL